MLRVVWVLNRFQEAIVAPDSAYIIRRYIRPTISKEPYVANHAPRQQRYIHVSQPNADKAGPGIKSVTRVQEANLLPDTVSRLVHDRTGVAIQAASYQVAE